MGMAVGGEDEVRSEPNVIPMIDIMLVLLIIFMIVTPVIAAGFQATMPQGKNIIGREEESGDIVLGIDVNGQYYLDPGSGKISPVKSSEDLEGFLTRIYESRTRDKILYFRADQELEYGVIEDALEVAQKAGVRVLAAVTEEKREGAIFGRRR